MMKEQRVRHLQPHGIRNITEAGSYNFSRPTKESFPTQSNMGRDTTQVPEDSMIGSRIESEASISPMTGEPHKHQPRNGQPDNAGGDNYEMGGIEKDVIEKNFPIFSFGFVFGCLFLLIAGLGFSAIQSFRLSSGSLTSAFLIAVWPLLIDLVLLRPIFCFGLAFVLSIKSKLYSREKVKMDLGMINTKLIGTDFNSIISSFYQQYQFYKSSAAPKHVLNVDPEYPQKREMTY